jgi:hypothetical protein
MSALPATTEQLQTDFPASIAASAPSSVCANSPLDRVGAVLQAFAAAREVSDRELRQHANDCGFLMESAYARFEECHDPAARDEAVLWLDRRNQVVKLLQARGTQLSEPGDDAGFFSSDEAQAMGKVA